MHFSYWERQTWFNNLDLVVIGSGLVGLSAAYHYQKKHPKHKVLVIERGILPYGASTRNAGFACFGSPSELLDDLESASEEEVFQRVEDRYRGFSHLLQLLGAQRMGYEPLGGHELFRQEDLSDWQRCKEQIGYLNQSLQSVFPLTPFLLASLKVSAWGFSGVHEAIDLPNEGQINPGKTIFHLLSLCREVGVLNLTGIQVFEVEDIGSSVHLDTSCGIISARQVAICTNGLAQDLLKNEVVVPARAQVFITEPIEGLPFKGVFHMHKGYYYFRNVGNRMLLGGGRHLFRQEEETDQVEINEAIQSHLRQIARNHLLPNVNWQVAESWSGIMGFGNGNEKGSLVKKLSSNVVCGVRLGGMGIAIGHEIGRKTADLLED